MIAATPNQRGLLSRGRVAERAKTSFCRIHFTMSTQSVHPCGIVRELEGANPGVGGYEVRPISLFLPGSGIR